MILHGFVSRSPKRNASIQKRLIHINNGPGHETYSKILKQISFIGLVKRLITLPYNPATNLTIVSQFFYYNCTFGFQNLLFEVIS